MTLKLYEHACLLSNVRRFSGVHLDQPYTVAEHCFRVAILAMMVADDFNSRQPAAGRVDVEEVLKKALLHDIEEGYFGDIPAPAKNYTPELKAAYKAATAMYSEREIFVGNPGAIPPGAPGAYAALWAGDKEGLSGEIIKLTDLLEALASSGYETRRGNVEMRKKHIVIRRWFDTEDGKAALAKFPAARPVYERAIDVRARTYDDDRARMEAAAVRERG